jgi:thiamine biosynthesis lipoprotein
MSPETAVHRFAHDAMNTGFEVRIAGEAADYARTAAQKIFDRIDRIEVLLSRFDPGSEIARINRLSPGGSLAVSCETFDCLTLARQFCDDTGGLFDPTVGPLVRYRRRLHVEQIPPDPAEVERLRGQVGMDRLLFHIAGDRPDLPPGPDEPHRHLIGLHPDAAGIDLDLGGIGKGFALDMALGVLEEFQIGNALLSAGGSTVLAVGGKMEGEGNDAAGHPPTWRLGIGGLWAERADAPSGVELRDCAISGSGTEAQGEHILDPHTGHPGRRALQAWSLGPSATACDALSTAFIMMPPEQVKAFCSDHPQFSAYVVYEDANDRPDVRLFGTFFDD